MNPEQLKQHLETLSHRDRVLFMVELGARVKTDDRVNQVLDILATGDVSDRLMLLYSTFGSYDPARVLSALTDPSRGVRSLAMRLLSLVADDSQLQIALNRATFKQRRYLLSRLLIRHRYSCIDNFLMQLVETDHQQFGRLLPYGSLEIVNLHIQTVVDLYGVNEWRLLARRHPELSGNLLEQQANLAEDLDPRLAYQINAVLLVLAEFSPETALLLCRAASRTIPLARLSLQPLALRRPQEIAKLILSSDSISNVRLDSVAHKLAIPQLIELLTRRKSTVYRRDFLRLLTPSDREIIYDNFANSWRDPEGCLTPDLIANLPTQIRNREARYHLNLPALATRPAQRLPYAAFLPWAEARIILEPFIRNPDPNLRSIALTIIIAATRYNRAHKGEILTIVKLRRNEQDPIRGTMITELAKLPPSIWKEENLDDLSQIINDALNAADLSYNTASALERLVIAILPFQPAWSAQQLAILVQQRGQVSFYNLGKRLSDADVSRIAPFLLPVLESWKTREREHAIVSAAQSLGRRLGVFDGLVDILEQIINDTRNDYIASSILGLITEHQRDRFKFLVPKLLKQDPSWITQSTVYDFVHRNRQDLLTPFLGQQAYRGRFSTGKTRFVLPLYSGFSCWTTAQQQIFAKTLCEVIQDNARDSPCIFRVINQLAALPAVIPTKLIQLASHLNPKLAIRDRALQALSRLDAGQGIPILIESMGDDRARIAIYALRSTLLELPIDRALMMLRDVPLEKVTVAKEVVRLLGELPTDLAYQELLTWDKSDLHRDVRIAFLRALWSHLERVETWPILENAAISTDAAIATAVGRIPADRLSPLAQQQLLELLSILLAHSDQLVRLHILNRCYELPVSDPNCIILSKLLHSIDSPLPDECLAATKALLTTYSGKSALVIGDAVKSLIGNRRALQTLVEVMIEILHWRRSQLLPTARAVITAMEIDPLTKCLQIQLAMAALPFSELAIFFQELVISGQMNPEILWVAVSLIRRVTERDDVYELAQLEIILSTSDDDRLRRIALAILIDRSQTDGWDDERTAKLANFCNDPSPLVAEKAQFTFPPHPNHR
jgi:hypothetical protein